MATRPHRKAKATASDVIVIREICAASTECVKGTKSNRGEMSGLFLEYICKP